MMKRVFVVSLALVLGCKKPPPPVESAPDAAVEVDAAPPPAVMPAAGAPGFVYITSKKLISIDPEGNVKTIEGKRGDLETAVRTSDGKAYALYRESLAMDVMRVDGTTLTLVGGIDDCDPRRRAFDARGDHMVVKCYEGYFEKKGATFEQLPKPPDGFDDAVWISKDGTPWYGSDKGVSEFKNGAWVTYEKPESMTFAGAPDAFFDGPDGVYFTNHTSLYKASKGKITEERSQALGWSSGLHASPNGLFGYSGEKSIQLFVLGGPVKMIETKTRLERGAAIDERGRAWALLDGQVTVVDDTGTNVVTMGGYPELDRITTLSELVVLGAGAKLPTSKAVRHTKKITAKITIDSKPLAEAAVELCPRAAWVYTGGTPCSSSPENTKLVTTTDAKGAFTVENAPMGTYYLHYRKPDANQWSIETSEIEPKENAITDLGTIALKSLGTSH